MPHRLPSTMRALVLDAYHGDVAAGLRALRVRERPLVKPRRGQVVVRIEAAPCNPSDEILIAGRYGTLKQLPCAPGWEGAGTVVASGGGIFANWLVGKRVACGGQGEGDGTWAEYFVTEAMMCIPLRSGVSTEQGASLIINPLTALGMVRTAKRGRHRAAVQTAAASQLGRMLLAVANQERLPLINVVRRDDQAQLVRELGARHVLNSEDADFDARLADLCRDLGATIAFDAVAGATTGRLLSAMPGRSKVLVYGELSHAACSDIDPGQLIFHEKQVAGFYLASWLKQIGGLGTLRAARRMQKLMERGAIATAVWRRATLDDAPAALLEHLAQSTRGKVLILPHGGPAAR